MKLEIVSHCWNYARLLTYQLSSLVLFPVRNVQTTMTVFFCPEDGRTSRVLDYFGTQRVSGVQWQWWPLERSQLLNRAIGRNLAALQSIADWIWFADADMCFRQDCLGQLAIAVAGTDVPLIYPRTVQINRTHALGDSHIEAASGNPRILDVQPDQFVATHYSRAIGGVQICRGEVMRSVGYCNDRPNCQQPRTVWRRCVEDVAFRRSLRTSGLPVDVSGVYRIRHSRQGRDHPGIEL